MHQHGIIKSLKNSHIQAEDISAILKNGVLTLTIDCGKPFEQDDEQEVPVGVE